MTDSEYQEIHWSSDSDEWATPPDLLRPLADAVDGFDLDPCSGAEERSIADETYTEADDGLASPWHGRVWMNPPYSEIADWMDKARREASRPDVELVVCLVPARTSTQWWHTYAVDAAALCFLEGRLSFGDSGNSAPFPSALVVFGRVPTALPQCLDRRGAVYRKDQRYQTAPQQTLDDLEGGEDP